MSQDTWELQEKYIVEDKIGKTEPLLCKIKQVCKVEEVWNDVVLDLLSMIK